MEKKSIFSFLPLLTTSVRTSIDQEVCLVSRSSASSSSSSHSEPRLFFNRPGRVHGERRECDARTPLCASPSSSSPSRCCGRASTLDEGGEPRPPQGMDGVRGRCCSWRRSVRARQNCYYIQRSRRVVGGLFVFACGSEFTHFSTSNI